VKRDLVRKFRAEIGHAEFLHEKFGKFPGARRDLFRQFRLRRVLGQSLWLGDNGFSVTFSDSAANDIHFYQDYPGSFNPGGQLVGTWQPDGENIPPLSDPSAFDDTLSRQTAMLGSFDGGNPNDTWTLFLADLSEGGTAQVTGWSLDITTVPEPPEANLLGAGLVASLWFLRRRTMFIPTQSSPAACW